MAAWRARPLGALAVRGLVLCVPVATSIATAIVLGHVLTWPSPHSAPWWAVLLGGATLASVVVGRLARRLLPLAVLLRLTLAFPDRTPSRFAVALRAGSVGQLRRQVHTLRAEGVGDDLDTAVETVLVLAAALNAHDPKTRGHSERVRALTEMLAAEVHLPAEDVDRLRWSALLHDCGKIMVHADVLQKAGPLTEEDWEAVRRHPQEGAKLTAPLRGWLGPWAAAIEEHHERWDGEGYPNGLAGDELSFGARLVAVADAYEVMTAARSYKAALSPAEARAELAAQAGRQFDPEVVRAFLRISLGRAGWLSGPLSWLGGLALLRQVVTRTPRDIATAGLAGGGLVVAGALGLLAADPSPPPAAPAVAAPAERPRAFAVTPPTTPPEVLGVQFTAPPPAPVPVTRPAPLRRPVPTTTVPAAPPATTVTTAPPPPPAVAETCTDQAHVAIATTPAASRLAEVRATQPAKTSGNPNCTPVSPGR